MNNNSDSMRILFVCLGNICRSPTAEAIFKLLAAKNQLNVEVDSAGTSAWHQGEMADHRMRSTAAKRGYKITSLSRQFQRNDFDNFDMIIAMDDQNYHDLKDKAHTKEEENKIFKMKDFFMKLKSDHIPDPYYGGAEGFNYVVDLLEDASFGLIQHIKNLNDHDAAI
ncbi:MAG: phosphotyrosine protein phosphatase [Bacteroidetes bacterium HGW-Bacteroidetes-1]|jgi:protein-tyrosine phosphatase|nr:MAG: phosphotyrosine protein phosphatase [Bacteroidetes bacterium HGW-Bacteroidetes-1]